MNVHDKVGKNIKIYRLKQNLTLEDLSHLTGVSIRRLKIIETIGNKKRLTMSEICKIANALQVPLKLLFRFDD